MEQLEFISGRYSRRAQELEAVHGSQWSEALVPKFRVGQKKCIQSEVVEWSQGWDALGSIHAAFNAKHSELTS